MSEQAMRMEPPDLRRLNAQRFASAVLQIVGKYITNERDVLQQAAYRDLFTAAYEAEIELTSKNSRALEHVHALERLDRSTLLGPPSDFE